MKHKSLPLQTEEQLQINLSDYIKMQYPKLIFNSDLSGIKLTKGQAVKVKRLRSGRGFPDMVIYHANKAYHGLFMELKRETPYKKNGEFKKDKHLYEQVEMIENLLAQGYCAGFIWDFDFGKETIDKYMRIK